MTEDLRNALLVVAMLFIAFSLGIAHERATAVCGEVTIGAKP